MSVDVIDEAVNGCFSPPVMLYLGRQISADLPIRQQMLDIDRLVFKTDVQPDGFVRLVHDYLVFVCGHLGLPFMRILYQTTRTRAKGRQHFHTGNIHS